MLLKTLAEYSYRLDSQPAFYAEVPVRYIIDLDGFGNLLGPNVTDTADPANPRMRHGVRRLVPYVRRSRRIRPILFASNAEYTLGLARDPRNAQRVSECRQAYMDMVRRCAERTGLKQVRAVSRFLEHSPLAALKLDDDFDRGAAITFRVGGTFAVDLAAVQRFWAEEHDPANASGAGGRTMQCMVCGKTRLILPRLQVRLKNLPGKHGSEASLVSASSGAFESYGLEASLVAPTCADCSERFTRAANHLLGREESRIVIAGNVFIFWSSVEGAEVDLRTCLAAREPARVQALIDPIRAVGAAAKSAEAPFYVAAFSVNGGRVAVRDWIRTTVGQARASLAQWFERQRIVGPFGEAPRPVGLAALAGATVRTLHDLSPPVPAALIRSAVTGMPPPLRLLSAAVLRNRIEQTVTGARAALIKLVLNSRLTTNGAMVTLDTDNRTPVYLCGRLLAVLERMQRFDVPQISPRSTIGTRFFATASSAPLFVFPGLLRGAQAHLGNLKRTRPDIGAAFERQFEEIIAGIGAFPATCTLEEQGVFALGYYHQRARDRAQANKGAGRARTGGHGCDGVPEGSSAADDGLCG